jgi:hypothetical protein
MPDMPAKIKALQAKGKATWELHTKDEYVNVVCECLLYQKLYPETAAQMLRILTNMPGAVPLTVADIKRAGIDCWQWSTKEYSGFLVKTVLPAVALNIASLGLDVEQLLDWLDEQNALPHKICGKASDHLQSTYAIAIGGQASDHQQSTYAIAIGGKASDPVTYGHVSPWYQQYLHAIAIGNWSGSNVPTGYSPKTCLVRAIVQARWSGRRAAWFAACCQI